jgi:hypothetical protein
VPNNNYGEMITNYNDIEKFLFNANKNGYAGGSKEITPQRPGFEELEYTEGDWLYHDSYSGHYFAPGQEVVYFKGKPIWAMAYAGGMKFKYHGIKDLTHETFVFLKKALLATDPEKPFRGPESFTDGDWEYKSTVSGDIKDFSGTETITYKNKSVFSQNFIGGIIVQ